MGSPSNDLWDALKDIRLLLCDVDGVLTDGSVGIGLETEMKRFHIRDGLGQILLQSEGVKVGWVSNRPSAATESRAKELRVDFLFQDKADKLETVEGLLNETGIDWGHVCYVGDDIVDLAVVERAAVGVAVADAVDSIQSRADYVTVALGGRGAVREVAELILTAQGKWDSIIQRCSQ